ncbi:MAG: hypothetical protein P1V20_11065 [Verrucomicrobiales bacterium]|nr:hypothetical protein [Verrucomicrobiales bacterium]
MKISSLFLPIFLLLPAFAEEPKSGADRKNPYLALDSYFCFAETGDPLNDWNSVREWTAADGRTMKAKILSVQNGTGDFLLPGNQKVHIPLTRFCAEDQRFISEWREISRFFNLGYFKSRNVSNTVQAGITDGAFAREGKVHETRNFRFVSDQPLNATTVKDFSRMFEATYSTVRTLPLALEVAKPKDGKFLVRLFSNKEDYHRAGGPLTSAGVYILKSREILVPFESLGLQRTGNAYRKAGQSDPSTLIHEITHAVTHQWLNYLPMWVAEGLADYVAAIPYKNGSFYFNQHEEGIYKMVASNFGGNALRFRILQPEEFVYLDSDQYMARPSEPEKPIELTAVKPYQIRLLGEEPTPRISTPSKNTVTSSAPTGLTPVAITPPTIGNSSSIVVQRYSSSMLLLHQLISSGQVSNLRKYLFAHLHFTWDSEKYINDYNKSLDTYQGSVKAQIEEFDEVLRKYNDAIHAYNEVVKLRNAGEDVTLPAIPAHPVAPDAIAVPEILASPRPGEAFSRDLFRKVSVDKYLELPVTLGL